jgi:hypothetical protein
MAAILTLPTPARPLRRLIEASRSAPCPRRGRSKRGITAYRLRHLEGRRVVRTRLVAIVIVPLMHIVGNIHEKIGHIRGHGVQHPGEKEQQRHKQDHHFRNKRERGFVQLRHGLECTNSQADEQTKPQNR